MILAFFAVGLLAPLTAVAVIVDRMGRHDQIAAARIQQAALRRCVQRARRF